MVAVCFFCSDIHFLKISEFFIYLFFCLFVFKIENQTVWSSVVGGGDNGGREFWGGETMTRVYYAKKSNKNVKTTHLTEDYKYIAPDLG